MQLQFPLLLDGGLSNELESLGCDLNHPLWSARLLDQEADKIVAAHVNYIRAGAKCIITSSYQASIPGFMNLGYSKQKAEELILRSVWAAQEAIRQCGVKDVLIAASVGPYGAYLGDGSEYHGRYGVSDEVLREFHEARLNLLAGSPADLLACETMPSLQEAKVLHQLLSKVNKPAWMSFTCADDKHLQDGTPIRDMAKLFSDHPGVFAMGVNCTKPEYVSGLIRELKSVSHQKKIVVYPNSGEKYDAVSKKWSGPVTCSFMAREWLAQGADIIGGCCRVGPAEIKKIASSI